MSPKGVVAWIPSENQGPGTYPVEVRVTDNRVPPLNDRKQFNIVVNEVPDPVVRTVWEIGTDNVGRRFPMPPPRSSASRMEGTRRRPDR